MEFPRVEFGVNAGGLLAGGGQGLFTPGVRVGVAVIRRFAIESGFDSLEFDRSSCGKPSLAPFREHIALTRPKLAT